MSSYFDPYYTFLNSISAIMRPPPATTPVVPYTPSPPATTPVVPYTPSPPAHSSPKPVPFSGMAGYSERGAPDDWDTAMGEVYGYRWWYMAVTPEQVGYLDAVPRAIVADRLPGILYGANNRPWKDGRLEAVCTRTLSFMETPKFTHQPPETREACGCGFWAYFNKGLYVDQVLSSNFAGPQPHLGSYGAVVPVFGVVKGTGRVIIGEKGFRSQYAQIMGLCLPQVTVNQLQWWITPGLYDPYLDSRDAFGNTYNAYFSSRSRGTYYENCSPAEHLTRVSAMETILSEGYPSAKIFSSQDLLTQYFPPDKNYA